MKEPKTSNRKTNYGPDVKRSPMRDPSTALCLAVVIFAVMLMAGRIQAQTWTLSSAWSAANGIGHLANNNDNRGIAYSVLSNQVFVTSRAGATTGNIDVFDGTAGTLLSGTNITGGNLGIDQIGVADDGVIYGMPLQTAQGSSAPITLYSWTNWVNNGPYTAYASTATDPVTLLSGTKRIGDTMAVTGAGVNTLILLTVNGTGNNETNFVLLHTADGINFTSTVVTVPAGLPSTAGVIVGISFYTNNTFLVQPGSGASGRNVYLVSYPANFASQSTVTGTVLANATVLTSSPDNFVNYAPLGQMLASVQTGTTGTSTAGIYGMANYASSVAQLATTTFSAANANANATGGAALGGQGKTNYLYVLDSNNGLLAYQINFTPGAIGPTITGPTGVTNTGAPPTYPPQPLTVTVTAGTAPFYYQWYIISGGVTNSISGATNSTYTVTSAVTNLDYYVVVTNAATSANVVTSAVVGVTLASPVTNSVVSTLWSAGVGTYGNFLLDNDATRGIGYDTNTSTVVVSSETGVFAVNGNTGAYVGALNVSGLTGGTFTLDQVGAADDGFVYAGNLAIAGQSFSLYQWPSANNLTATAYTSFLGDTRQQRSFEPLGSTRWQCVGRV